MHSKWFFVIVAVTIATVTYVSGDQKSEDSDDRSVLRIKRDLSSNERSLQPAGRGQARAGHGLGANSRIRRHGWHGQRNGMGQGRTGFQRRGQTFNWRDRHQGMRRHGEQYWGNQHRQPMGGRGGFGYQGNRNVEPGLIVHQPRTQNGNHFGAGTLLPQGPLQHGTTGRGAYGRRAVNQRNWYGMRQGHGGGHGMRFGPHGPGVNGPGSHGRHHGRGHGGLYGGHHGGQEANGGHRSHHGGHRGRGGHGCHHSGRHGGFGGHHRGHHGGHHGGYLGGYGGHHQQHFNLNHYNHLAGTHVPETRQNDTREYVQSNTQLPLLPNVQRKLNLLSTAQNKLTARLHREIAVPRSNIVYSPYGVYQSLTMVYLGSRRRTAFQMTRVLNLIFMGRHIHFPIMHQNNLLDDPADSTLEMGNAVFLPSNISVNTMYSDLLASTFRANVSNFQDGQDPEETVNEMAAFQTNNIVSTVIRANSLVQEPHSITLMNVMYFKGKWKTPFPAEQTFEWMFNQTSQLQVPVDVMVAEGMFKVGVLPGHNARLLRLPYADDRFSMLIVLPNELDGLSEIEESLTADDLAVDLDTSIPTRVRVFLPKFKIDSTLLLKEDLQDIGMTGAFDAIRATLDGVSQDSLHVNDIIHKAVVEVAEDGEDISTNSIPETVGAADISEFRCDHPFLFLIRDHISKVNLFVGKFSGGSQ